LTTCLRADAGAGCNYPFLTRKERDFETGLDYFGARYYGSTQGRFTSADPIMIKKARLLDPQRINLYAYVRNNPLKFIDPDGADLVLAESLKPKQREFIVKNLARLYMTEKGRAIIERVDKSPFVVTLGRAELTRKDLNPAKPGEKEKKRGQACDFAISVVSAILTIGSCPGTISPIVNARRNRFVRKSSCM